MLNTSASAMAIRAALFLALQPSGALSPVREIAEQTGLPEPYLAKIVRQLASAGLVRAFRGPGGGVTLSRPPQAINLWDIVRALEGSPETDMCMLGLRTCSAEVPCPVHDRFAPIRAATQRLLEETTLATLTNGLGGRAKLGRHSWVRLAEAAIRRPAGTPGKPRARRAKTGGTGE